MNNTPWKCHTGHKSGYLTFVEKELKRQLPGTDIKGTPHIKSKVKTMKKMLGYVLEIQKNGSGFGWDDEKKMVLGEEDIFMGWAKSRDGASQLYRRPMPHFDKLVEIYALDMAKGARAKAPGDHSSEPVDVVDEAETVDLDECEINSQPTEPITPNTSTINGDASGSHTRPTQRNSSQPSQKRKAPANDPMEEHMRGCFLELKKSWDKESEMTQDMKTRTDNLYHVITALGGSLSKHDVVNATRLICQDPNKVNAFYSMPDDETKLIFVQQEIGN
ncbi:hypothetical protein M5689_004414 [Euphorbia peplus]|nr:hypothetical protein M5689_004414 [Euphorbia peplus]